MGKKIIQKDIQQESDSEDELQDNMLDEQKEVKVNREQVIQQKIQDIHDEFKKRLKLNKKQTVNWHEHMSLVSDQGMEIEKMDINDDIQREVQFYNIAVENAKLAIKYLKSENIPIRRPDDYFAEMFKTDQQMAKVKNRLVQQQVKVQNFEEKLLRAQSKKLAKKIKARTEFNKHKEKRDNLQAIEEWKKEISNKGEKAKDLSEFLLKKNDFKNRNKNNQNKSGGNFNNKDKNKFNNNNNKKNTPQVKRNSGGGKKIQRQGKTIQRRPQQGKGQNNNRGSGGRQQGNSKGPKGQKGGKGGSGKRPGKQNRRR